MAGRNYSHWRYRHASGRIFGQAPVSYLVLPTAAKIVTLTRSWCHTWKMSQSVKLSKHFEEITGEDHQPSLNVTSNQLARLSRSAWDPENAKDLILIWRNLSKAAHKPESSRIPRHQPNMIHRQLLMLMLPMRIMTVILWTRYQTGAYNLIPLTQVQIWVVLSMFVRQ